MIFQPQDHNDRLCSAHEDGHDDDSARAYAGKGVPLPKPEIDDEPPEVDLYMQIIGSMIQEDPDAPPAHENGPVGRFDPQTDHGEPKGA